MAIAYTKMGQTDQAIKCYRGALQIEPKLSGAHYGLAFLLLKKQDAADAAYHLDAFLMDPPHGPEAERWIKHAQATLDSLNTTTEPFEGTHEFDGEAQSQSFLASADQRTDESSAEQE
jgi:tetratricopeptide (TPR) repeat protein